MARWLEALAFALLLAASPGTPRAAVFAWRDGATLHFSNDARDVPEAAAVHRFESHVRAPARMTAAAGMPSPSLPAVALDASAWGPAYGPASPTFGPIIVAPSITVRSAPPGPIVIEHERWAAGSPFSPWAADGLFFPSGFIGHEHPQIGFLAGSWLVPHSHFFAHGRAGRFMPWGHYSVHGVLHPHP